MKCPRCVQAIHRAAESCPHCGFSMGEADARFGGDDLRTRCLSDKAGVLKRGDRARVEAAMEKFGQLFPQLFVAIHTGSVGGIAHLRPFGFWLLNRAAFEDLPEGKPMDAGILLTLDPQSKSAGMVFGYLLDPYLSEEDTFECLSRAHAYWLEGRYAEGMIKAILHLEELLKRRCRHARRNSAHYERKVFPQGMKGDSARRTRDDQRVTEPQSLEVTHD